MLWHRQNQTFPALGLLRRYLKLCYYCAKQNGRLGDQAVDAAKSGLPFDPCQLPRKFPPAEMLVWDHAYPESVPPTLRRQ